MKAKIKISSSYGFDHNWTLEVSVKNKTKSFLLGQDVKFCNRVLQIDASEIIKTIGTREIEEGTKGNEKLAKFICKELNVNAKTMDKIKPWGLCCQ